jgi:hypothetical protein
MLMYSKSQNEIYDTNIHKPGRIASDAVEITAEEHAELIKPIVHEQTEEQRIERLIKSEMYKIVRKQAIESLKSRSELPLTFNG